jgi:hypothetical protein
MASHMKTTVQISDSLLAEAQLLARRERTTLKALVQEGLRKVLDEHKQHREYRLRDASFGGTGLQPPLTNETWELIRGMAYEGRGG